MLGVKTCRAVRTCCAGRALGLSVSARARAGPAVWHAGVGPLAACLAMAHATVHRLTPNTRGRPSVICIRSIRRYWRWLVLIWLDCHCMQAIVWYDAKVTASSSKPQIRLHVCKVAYFWTLSQSDEHKTLIPQYQIIRLCQPGECVQWNLVITRSLGPWKLPFYIRFLIISG